jgi:hypothetical protein
MGKLILENHYNHTDVVTNQRNMCILDNITIMPLYHTNDSLSYMVSRCNYCRKEWGEFWISYGYIFASLIEQHQSQQHI